MNENELSYEIIGAAIEVHKHLGPGLLESAYEECLCYELKQKNIHFERQLWLPMNYPTLFSRGAAEPAENRFKTFKNNTLRALRLCEIKKRA